MSTRLLSDRDVLEKLGADRLIAAGYSEHQIKKWVQKDRGIPWRERPKISSLAAVYRVRLPADFLLQRRAAA